MAFNPQVNDEVGNLAAALRSRSQSGAAITEQDQLAQAMGRGRPSLGQQYIDAYSAHQAEEPAGVGFSDYAKSIMLGFAGLGNVLTKGVGWLARQTGATDLGNYIDNLGTSAVDYWNDSLSPAAQREISKSFVSRNEFGEWEWGGAGLQTALLQGAESIPGTAAGMGLGAGLTRVLQVFANPFGREVLRRSAAPLLTAEGRAALNPQQLTRAVAAARKLRLVDTALGLAGFGVGEGAVSAPYTAINVYDQIMALPQEALDGSPRYQQVYNSTSDMPDADRASYARETVAREAATEAGFESGLTTSLLGAPMGAFFGRVLGKTGRLGSTRLRATLSGLLGEAGQEAAQSFVETEIAGHKVEGAGGDVDILSQAINDALAGAAAGGLMGGAFGVATFEGEGRQQAGKKPGETAPGSPQQTLQRAAMDARTRGVPLDPIVAVIQSDQPVLAKVAAIRRLNAEDFGTGAPGEPPGGPPGGAPQAPEIPPMTPTGEALNPFQPPPTPAPPPEAPPPVARAVRPSSPVRQNDLEVLSDVDQAAHQAAASPLSEGPPPSEAQDRAENYRVGRVSGEDVGLPGMKLSVEYPRGTQRNGIEMTSHYGRFTGTMGGDGQAVDFFLGDQPENDTVYVYDHYDELNRFHQHKVLIGFADEAAARAELDHFYRGAAPREIVAMTKPEFEKWAAGDTTTAVGRLRPDRVSRETGSTQQAITPTGKPMPVQYQLREADQLIVSNDTTGEENPRFPRALQPRDRERAGMRQWLNETAGRFQPQLVVEGAGVGEGTPVISDDGVVESGNGRAALIQRVYQQGNAEAYKAYLAENAARFGLTPEQVAGLKQPVLVRVRTQPMSFEERQAFAAEANQPTTARYSPTEQARADAAAITDAMLQSFEPSENGNVLAPSNDAFVRAFTQALPAAARAELTTAEGRPTKQLADRIQAAVFQKAYANDQLLSLAAEEAEPDVKNVVAALVRAAPAFAQARAAGADVNMVTEPLLEAVEVIRNSRNQHQSLEEHLSQQLVPYDADVERMARFIDSTIRSSRRMGESLKALGDWLEEQAIRAETGDIFGAAPEVTLPAAFEGANQRVGQEAEKPALFARQRAEPVPMFSRNGVVAGGTIRLSPEATGKIERLIGQEKTPGEHLMTQGYEAGTLAVPQRSDAINAMAETARAHGMPVLAERLAGAAQAVQADTGLFDMTGSGEQGVLFSRAQVNSPEFRAWFGDSVVVDENGDPLVMYHGTFTHYPTISITQGMFWAADDPALASDYSMQRDGTVPSGVMPVYLKAERPFDADALPATVTVRQFAIQLAEQGDGQHYPDLVRRIEAAARTEESGPHYNRHDFWYRSQDLFGRDGEDAINELFDHYDFDSIKMTERDALTFGVFSADQVKSAIGNRGTFDPNNPNILYSRSKAPTFEELKAEIPYDVAYRAHTGTSFVPERRAVQVQEDYARQMVADYEHLQGMVRNAEEQQTFDQEWERYHQNFRSRYLAWLHSRSNVLSSMIAGPSNFPVRRAEKANRTEERRFQEFLDLRRKAMASIARQLRPELAPTRVGDEDAAATWQKKLDQRIQIQETMKAVNAALRSGLRGTALAQKLKGARDAIPELNETEQAELDAMIEKLQGAGLSAAAAREALTPDFMGGLGFASYQLSNNNAEIRRLRQQIQRANRYQAQREAVGGNQEFEFDRGTVELDYDENRIRVRIEKSDTETRGELKAQGFRWSPKNTAWQRQLTDNARAVTERITGIDFSEASQQAPEAAPEQPEPQVPESVIRPVSEAEEAAQQPVAPAETPVPGERGVPAEQTGALVPYEQLFVQRGNARFPVESFEDAAAKWGQFRDETGAGASEIGSGTLIVNERGETVAHISYNGKVWPGAPGDWQPGMRPLVGQNFQPEIASEPDVVVDNQRTGGEQQDRPKSMPRSQRPLFSRGQLEPTSPELRTVWQSLKPERLAPLLDIRFARTAADLPHPNAPADVEGAYFQDGQVWLVEDNLTPQTLRQKFEHEVYGHAAIERDPAFEPVIRAVRNALERGNQEIGALAREVRARQGVLDGPAEAREILALLAERGSGSSLLTRFKTALGTFARETGLRDPTSLSAEELKATLRLAARNLERDNRITRDFAAAAGQSPEVQKLSDSADPTDDEIIAALRAMDEGGHDQGLYSRPIQGFYSGLRRAAASLRQERGTGAQMLAAIQKAGGVKQEELEWTGLHEWLEAQDKVTREQILGYLDGHGVQVEETELAGQERDYNDAFPMNLRWGQIEHTDDNMTRVMVEEQETGIEFEVTHDPDSGNISIRRIGDRTGLHAEDEWLDVESLAHVSMNQQSLDDVVPAIQAYLDETMDATPPGEGPTQYDRWTLPMGENYREVLLQLPEQVGEPEPEPLTELPGGYGTIYDQSMPPSERWGVFPVGQSHARPIYGTAASTEEDAIRNALYRINQDRLTAWRGRRADTQFSSGHFDEYSNIIAWARLTDRTDNGGRRVLFVEELQSDWHQRGRKHGYKKPKPQIPEFTIVDRGLQWAAVDANGNEWGTVGKGVVDGEAGAREYLERYIPQRELEGWTRVNADTVPDAPFKGSAWSELAVKKVLAMAAEQGYDAVAWTTGQQQVDRYDLSRHIASVAWHDAGSGGVMRANLDAPTRTGQLIARNADGATVIERHMHADELPGYIGEELAGRLLAAKPRQANVAGIGTRIRELSGLDLRTGGEGMRGFYDTMLPRIARKMAQRLDKQAVLSPITLANASQYRGDSAYVFAARDFMLNRRSIDEARAGLKEAYPTAPEKELESALEIAYGTGVNGIMITPDMKRFAAAGQPLFSRRGPQVDAATQETIDRTMAPAPEQLTIMQRVRGFIRDITSFDTDHLVQGFIDEANSIKRYEENQFGGLLDASESAYKATLATRNLASAMVPVMLRGSMGYRDGAFQINPGTKGVVEIFRPLTDHPEGNLLHLWENYASAKRAEGLRAAGKKFAPYTSADVDRLVALEQRYPVFRQVLDDWTTFNNAHLDLLVDRGVLDRDMVELWKQNVYAPWYRVLGEDQEAVGPGAARRGMSQHGAQRIKKRLKAESTKPIGNVFENMMMNTAYMVDEAFKNEAMRRIAELTENVGMTRIELPWEAVSIPNSQIVSALKKAGIITGTKVGGELGELSAEQKAGWTRLFRRFAPRGPNIVSYYEGGKPVYFEVQDDLLLRSIQAIGYKSFDHLVQLLLGGPKRLLTGAVTLDPAFMAANLVRDTLSTFVVAGAPGMKPIIDGIKGAKGAFQFDKDMMAIMAAGGGGGGYYDVQPGNLREFLVDHLGSTSKATRFQNTIVHPKGLYRFWRRLGNAAENANRVAVYRAVRASGGSVAEGAHQARDVLNFSMHGDYAAMRLLTMSVPFLNARVQGLYRLWRGAKSDPKGFAYRGSMILAATAALLLRNDKRDEYDELPEWDKDTYWHLFLNPKDSPVGDGDHWRIPKPFEVGLMFGTVPERIYRRATGKDSNEIAIQQTMSALNNTLAFNPIPQTLRPAVEQFANRTFFTDRPIVGYREQDLPETAQYGPWTSETARLVADALPEWAPGFLRSPERLEHLVRGYLGATGMYVLGASDAIARSVGPFPDRESARLSDRPIVRRFLQPAEPAYTKYSDQLYDLLNEADGVYRAINVYREQQRLDEANELRQKNQPLLAVRAQLRRIANQVTRLNNQQRRVLASDIPPDEKREQLDAIRAQKNDLVARVARFADL